MTFKTFTAAAALALGGTLGGTAAEAALLDLSGFVEGPAVAGDTSAGASVSYDDFFGPELFADPVLTLENGLEISFFLAPGSSGIFDVAEAFPGPGLDGYTIAATGFSGTTLEMLLELDPLGPGTGSVGFGNRAVARFSSGAFDFSGLAPGGDPMDAFIAAGPASYDLSAFSVAALAPEVIPLPAGGLLLLTAGGALVALRRRRSAA